MKMSSLTSTAHHRRSASEIAALITNAVRRSGRERCCIAETTLADLVGTRRISRATRRLICHEIQQFGFALCDVDRLMPYAVTAVISIESIRCEPVISLSDILCCPNTAGEQSA